MTIFFEYPYYVTDDGKPSYGISGDNRRYTYEQMQAIKKLLLPHEEEKTIQWEKLKTNDDEKIN